jgi:uncharacterized protein
VRAGAGGIHAAGAAWQDQVRICRSSVRFVYRAPLTQCETSPMWYLIEGFDRPGSLPARLAARGDHLDRLRALLDDGRLLAAGPCPLIDAEDPGPAGFSGSAIIAEFASLADARAWADADPYVAAGVYERVDVRPFRKVLP